jgi:hypothetical protein
MRLSPGIGCLAASLGRGWFDRIRCSYGHAGGQRRRLVRDGSVHVPNIGMVTTHSGLNGLTKVAQQMPPVGDLDSSRCTLSDPVRLGPGPIAGDNLNPGMLTQPLSEAVGLAIRQQVDHRMAFQIDQNGAIPATPAPRPVINRQDTRNGRPVSLAVGSAHQPQQRIGAGGGYGLTDHRSSG